ncbi:MAG: hypothetical protein ACRBFS_21595 [Aureispira sp.]
MKKDPKVILVVLITACALAVFVWMYIQKGKNKNMASESSTKEAATPDQTAYLAVEPIDPILETVAETTAAATSAPSKNALELLTIAIPAYSKELRAFDYVMNYEGAIVKGNYNDSLLPDYGGQTELMKQVAKNGAVFEIRASSYSPSVKTAYEIEKMQAVKDSSVSNKSGASKKGAVAPFRPIVLNKRAQKPNSVYLTISRNDNLLKWKMVDLLTGAIYTGIKGFEKVAAAYKEGDLSKKVYYLD